MSRLATALVTAVGCWSGRQPDLVVLDLDLGAAGDGGRLVAPLSHSGCRVLVLTGVTMQHGFEELTPREEVVLGGLLHGHAVDEIADRAVVAPSTVRSQVRSILRKLGVNSQLAAVARAREAGWDPPPMGS